MSSSERDADAVGHLWLSRLVGLPWETLARTGALLLLGVAALLALAGGESPPLEIRELTTLALTGFAVVAALLALWRRAAPPRVTLFDGAIVLALVLGLAIALRSPIRAVSVFAWQWQLSLATAYLGARLIGPLFARTALMLWGAMLVGIVALRWSEEVRIDGAILIEWALALGVIGLVWRAPTVFRRRVPFALLAGGCAAVHLLLISEGAVAEFFQHRAAAWDLARAVFWHEPLWGWGGGTWPWAVASLAEPPATTLAAPVSALEWILSAGGAMGFVAVLVIAVGIWRMTRVTDEPTRTQALRIACGALAFAWGLMGLWAMTPARPVNLIILALLIGAAQAMPRGEVSESKPRRLGVLRFVALGVVAALLVITALGPVRGWWTRSAASAEVACGRASVAARVMPWDARWPALEARMVGLWIQHDPAADDLLLRVRRELAYEHARTLHPAEVEFTTIPAEELMLQGQTDEAEALLREGLRRIPNDASLRWALATLLEQRGDLAEAFETLRTLDRLQPSGAGKVTLARLAWARGESATAQRFAREAIQLDNRSPALMALLAEMERWGVAVSQ